ncbi:hypothetical protein OG912_06620 [Streptomyces sp. NBC_00464]|uniref:hypothetical protein n=1 Tax=Streptomyces sp. NBC_00464 TaxID=2975751 RepID=UPI002E189444
MRKLLRSLVVPAAVAIGLCGSNAFATSGEVYAYGDGATATFRDYGEHLLITDDYADGHSAVAQVNWGDGLYTYWNPNGKGTTRDVDLDVAEGERVDFRACVGEYDGYLILTNLCSLYTVGIA